MSRSIKIILSIIALPFCVFAMVEGYMKFSPLPEFDKYETTVSEFAKFVEATGYVTDAEKYDSAYVLTSTFEPAKYLQGANWRKPDAVNDAKPDYPVTQVSYNDACAYCDFVGKRLPFEYEFLRKSGESIVGANVGTMQLWSASSTTKLQGNVYELSGFPSLQFDEQIQKEIYKVRVMGGSAICSPNSCKAYLPSIQKSISLEGGNNWIGFRCVK